MAKVRLHPFQTASSEAIQWANWYLVDEAGPSPLGPLLQGWDYDQEITLATNPRINLPEFMNSTGLNDRHLIDIVATADCSHTGERIISRIPLSTYLEDPDSFVSLTIPSASIAKDIQLRCHILLAQNLAEDGNVAFKLGSRLGESNPQRLILEGEASRFPTEALSFKDLRWEHAPWSIEADLSDFERVFAGSVRLFINTDHGIGRAVSRMDKLVIDLLGPTLRIDIVRSILHVAIDLLSEDLTIDLNPDPESVGGVVEAMCQEHFHMNFGAVAELKRTDFSRFERVIKASIDSRTAS